MITEPVVGHELYDFFDGDKSFYSIKRVYDQNNNLSVIQILDDKHRIFKCLFYDDQKRLSNMCIYNPITGKEVKNITYRADGKTISSVREYNTITDKLLNVIFFKPDGKSPSSIIEYNEMGNETQFTLFDESGETIVQKL